MRIPDDVIEAVRAANDIVEVIGEHVPLTPAGKRHKALCPFHTEKTPSFTVNPELQMFHCFGCGTGGNVFTFLMRHLGLTFPEAIELLAARAGITLPRRAEGGAKAGGTGRLLAAIEEATTLYERNLWERQAGAEARRYLAERGIGDDQARAARLGYAPAGFDHLRNRLASRHGLNVLVEAGLLVAKASGGRPYDRFRDRLMFPIQSTSGQVVGFGARCLDGSEPKYLNSPESPVYRKRDLLYGLHLARRALAGGADAIWVVEGYMDVLSLRQHGFGQVVAVSGTSLTPSHARLVARYTRKVVLLFDGDRAGRQAVVRSLPALVAEGLGVQVVLLPPGEDPDSVARAGGEAAVKNLLAGATNVVEFIVSLCQSTQPAEADDPAAAATGRSPASGLTPQAREAALRQVVELGSSIPDRVSRRLMVEEASRRLHFDEMTLAQEVEGAHASRGRATPRSLAPSGPARRRLVAGVPPDRRLESLLSLALAERTVLGRIADQLAPEDLPAGPHRRLYQLLVDRLAVGAPLGPADLAPQITDTEVADVLARLAVAPLPDDRERAAAELMVNYRADRLRREIEALRREIRDRETAGRLDEVPPLLARVQELQEEISAS